jgi:glycosyltransferase involved in cell wall biosynthesis
MTTLQNQANSPSCSVVIPTLGDRESIGVVLDCLGAQTVNLGKVVIALPPGKPVPESQTLGNGTAVEWVGCPQAGAAAQRNFGASLVNAEVLVFLDDDISFAADLFERVLEILAHDSGRRIGAVSPRMAASGHPKPSALLRRYYRWQAGYDDESFGARLFGFGLNLYPCYELQNEAMIAADWINSPCLFLRREDFDAVKFPDFHGYSAAEDIYLTAMIKKRGKQLFFLNDLQFEHHAGIGDYKADHFRLARMKTRNQGRIAREVLGLRGWQYWSKKITHQLFVSACLVRDRKQGWMREVAGVWSA